MYSDWTLKHKPHTLNEVVGNQDQIRKLVNWVKEWDKSIPKQRAVLVYGPPGIGKTVSIETLAKDLGIELIEKNASDYRTEEVLKKFAGLASQYSTLFGKKRIILVDELDGITGNADRGGVAALTAIIKSAKHPIVLTANNAYETRLATLRKYCFLIEFKRPPAGEVLKHLSRICSREEIKADEAALKFFAQRSEGDIRSSIYDLQALAQGKSILTFEDVSWLAYRDRKEAIFNVLRLIFYGKSAEAARHAIDMSDVDINMLFEWIHENIPHHLRDPSDLSMATKYLSTADIHRGRIMRSQNWTLTRYVIDFMTAGVALSRQRTKTTGFIPFRFPERIKALSKTRSERHIQGEIGLKIKKCCHISVNRARKEILPYVRIFFESNAEIAADLTKWLNLDLAMIEYLAGTKRQTKAILKNLEL